MSLALSFPSSQAAVDALIAEGFKASAHTDGIFVKPSMTGGSLWDAPRPCKELCRVKHNRVDPAYGADFYTVAFL